MKFYAGRRKKGPRGGQNMDKNKNRNDAHAAALAEAYKLDGVTACALRDVPRGGFFTLKPCAFPAEARVYIREEYERSSRKYYIAKFDDYGGGGRLMDGGRVVYVGFTF
jgi:hypothetical protein